MRRWAGFLIMVTAIVSVCSIGAQGLTESPGNGKRADLITIDTMKAFGELERPEVVFPHDLHTDALEKQKKDCVTCHLSGKNFEVIPDTLKAAVEGIDRMSPKFKRLKDIGKQDVMDVYHTGCIECHTNMLTDGEKSGPVVCGECHKEDSPGSSRVPMGFDNALHFRHSKAYENDKKCERCHHKFDEETKKLVYVKGKEDSCRYCHKEETEENRISMKLASHLSCIDCHREVKAQNKKAGPVKCAGCHDPRQQAAIEKVDPVPRMDRKQPDAALLKIKAGKEELVSRMGPVPFDHKAHETYNDTCRVCHHESVKPCNECHTLADSKDSDKGKGVRIMSAMHQLNTEMSCMGCHELKQQDQKCAGCHVFIAKSRRRDASCLKCHIKLPETEGQETQLSKEEQAATAAMMLQTRENVSDTFKDEDIPEKIVIKDMVNKYGPVEFPHRKIVHALQESLKDSKLATYFHSEKGTLCQGCHHKSPPAQKPPRCGNCHGRPFDEKNLSKPGKMGAYHIQCMGCHKEMGIEKPMGCTECHKEKT